MADTKDLEQFGGQLGQKIQDWARVNGAAIKLEEMFSSAEWKGSLKDLREGRIVEIRDRNARPTFVGVETDSEGNVLHVAAAIPRNDGRSETFLQQVADFADTGNQNDKQARKERVALFHRIYRSEGTINNAVNKMAALVAPKGSFKVKSVRGKPGKSGDRRAQEYKAILDWWAKNVNARPTDAVMTGARGVTSFTIQGVRQCLVEGDHIGRTVWKKGIKIPNLPGSYSLPMNITSFSAQHIEVAEGLEGVRMDLELLYWVPPSSFVQLLRNPRDPAIKQYLDKIIDPEVRSAIEKDGKYLLDPALMLHIKNRGMGIENFGESIIECVMPDIRYKRALDALEIVTIENLINRLVIVKVGSDQPDSVYHRAEVSAKRLQLLQRMFQRVGPSATILWAGPDIDVVEVGAHNTILALDERYAIADRRIRTSLGVPSVLLVGEGTDGKAAGWAAALGIAAQLQEIQEQYVQLLQTIAERIAIENGFEDVEVTWEFHDNLLENKETAAYLVLQMFDRGILDTRTTVEELGFDYDALEGRMHEDVAKGYRTMPFGPPLGAQTTNPGGQGGEDGGRPTKEQKPQRDPREDKERQTTEENS